MFVYVYRPGDPPAAAFLVDPKTALLELKQIVSEGFHIPVEQVTLEKDGQPLTGDSEALQKLGVRHKDVIHIVCPKTAKNGSASCSKCCS